VRCSCEYKLYKYNCGIRLVVVGTSSVIIIRRSISMPSPSQHDTASMILIVILILILVRIRMELVSMGVGIRYFIISAGMYMYVIICVLNSVCCALVRCVWVFAGCVCV